MSFKETAKHDIQRGFSFLRFFGILALIGFFGWSVYAGIVRPTTNPAPSTVQHAEVIKYITITPPKDDYQFHIKLGWLGEINLWQKKTKPTGKILQEIEGEK